MSTDIKNKIHKSLKEMDEKQLQSAYQVIKEFVIQLKYADIQVDQDVVETQIAKGSLELDNGEGTNFKTFLNEMNFKYGSKKK